MNNINNDFIVNPSNHMLEQELERMHSLLQFSQDVSQRNRSEWLNKYKNTQINDKISVLEKFTKTPDKNNIFTKEGENCSICFCEFIETNDLTSQLIEEQTTALPTDDNKICQLSCNHCFHSKCILNWLVKNKTCPNCRELCKVYNVATKEFETIGTNYDGYEGATVIPQILNNDIRNGVIAQDYRTLYPSRNEERNTIVQQVGRILRNPINNSEIIELREFNLLQIEEDIHFLRNLFQNSTNPTNSTNQTNSSNTTNLNWSAPLFWNENEDFVNVYQNNELTDLICQIPLGDVLLVIDQAMCTEEQAIYALVSNNLDLVNAIMELTG